MKTYPHLENGEIIQLVRKDEHDAIVQELNERLTKQQADMLDTIVQLRAELTNTHSILDGDESKIIRNAKDGYPEGREARVLTLAERVKSLCIYAADWKRWTEEKEVELTRWQSLAERLATTGGWSAEPDSSWDAALAAYNSAKKGNLPDPLAEAVKRMEKLRFGEIEAAYWQSGLGLENVRALLISAAKGEQP